MEKLGIRYLRPWWLESFALEVELGVGGFASELEVEFLCIACTSLLKQTAEAACYLGVEDIADRKSVV